MNHFHFLRSYTFQKMHWYKVALVLVICDILCIWNSYFLALWLRFDCEIDNIIPMYHVYWFWTIPIYALICVVFYYMAGLYNCIWRFVGYRELLHCFLAGFASISLYYAIVQNYVIWMPQSYYVYGGIFQIASLVATRFAHRFFRLLISRTTLGKRGALESAMLIGAGSAGQIILRDLSTTYERNIRFRCIIDDDKSKLGCTIEGVPVVGGRETIAANAKRYGIQKIYVAIPSASAVQRRDILNLCRETGCEVKTLPGLYQFSNDEVSLSQMRNISVNDLLGREPIAVNSEELSHALQGRVILVTGGGGSVGAELCRQIAVCKPRTLIVFDISENSVFSLQQDLTMRFPEQDFQFFVGSVRDTRRLEQIFEDFHPEIVFSAAGYKHLSMMEASPCEAIKNNVFGTYKTAYIALAYGCRKFILLSTDKAVNPTSILGASSRLCEMLMQTMEHLSRTRQLDKLFSPSFHPHARQVKPTDGRTEFAAIRFGVAMGAEGSIFQVFQKEIAAGGPVHVTDPNATRFCMALQDTVKLLLQATCYARDGEVFVIDMGEPYCVDDIARKLISLNGLRPDTDIRVEYTGLRAGEKLQEEPLMWEEGMRKTPSSYIYVANPTRIDFDLFLTGLEEFSHAVNENCTDVQDRMKKLCNSYHKSDTSSGTFSVHRLGTHQEPINNLERIAAQFDIPGEVIAAIPMNKGYINRTYRVETRQKDGSIFQSTLQRINTNVFPDAEKLMENFTLVTEHLQENFRLPSHPDRLANQLVIRTKDGRNFHQDDTGCWRMLTYISDVHSYDIPENREVFYHSGVAFGSFLKALENLPASKIHEVIPNFHNTWSRYQDLEAAIAKDPVGRVDSVEMEIEFVRSHKTLFKMISDALRTKEIPLRLGHNDCNLNNVLFEDGTNLPVAVIDLDTVMPSTPLYDYGDSMRIGTNTAKDDEKDLSKVQCDLSLYEAYARGWLEACGSMLTAREKELLPYASLVITSEDGIRFLMDHINGDQYYYIFYQGQNLDRARTQLRLLEDMEKKLPQIKQILANIYKELKL